MSVFNCKTIFASAMLAAVVGANAQTPGIKNEKIGIYDLAAIHSIPLNAQTISKTEDSGIVYEKVRFSSVDGIRVFAILSYKKGLSKAPGIVAVQRFKADPHKIEASNGYFVISVAAPDGNMDESKDDSVGGPKYSAPFTIDDQYRDNPKQSYIYQHTVALLRALDYLETRPEVNVGNTVVTGFSWPGLMVSTLHGLDDRPACYVLWHGLGFHADENGKSGGQTAQITRKQYEMYGAGTYCKLGKKPIYVGNALDDYFTKLDEIIDIYNNLNCEKAFSYAPNRHHHMTGRKEFTEFVPTWQTYWLRLFGMTKPGTIGEGTVKADGGKLIYTASVDCKEPLKWSEVLVSYGAPGNWMRRTWHSVPLVKTGDVYQAEIPVYDPSVPVYAIGQIFTDKDNATGNGPQLIEPAKLGISAGNSTYPNVLFDPSTKSDFYIRTGDAAFVEDSGDGKGSAIVKTTEAPNVMFNNVEPKLWKGATELHLWLKGDGKAGDFNVYLSSDSNYYLDKDVKAYTAINLVPTGSTMASGWKEYTIKLSDVSNLDQVTSIYFEPGVHTLQLGTVSWK